MFTILLVEDSLEYQLLVSQLLSAYRIIVTADPDQVKVLVEREKIDLVLLDISLPKRDGYSVLQELQVDPLLNALPVVCLTGKDQLTDKITAFSLGAEDFIQKPFNPMEFTARIDSKLRRLRRNRLRLNLLNVGDLCLDLASHQVFLGEQRREITLTQTEFKILHQLARHPGQVYSREQLLISVWGDAGAVFDRAVDVHISSLRKKLSGSSVVFRAISGAGYRLMTASRPSPSASAV